jgi:hypothetical protein
MNERIKELCKQAGFVGDDMYPIFGTSQETALKNLTELIVKDIMADLEKMREEYANPYGMYQPVEYYDRQAAKESAMEDALDTIRYKFEVQ